MAKEPAPSQAGVPRALDPDQAVETLVPSEAVETSPLARLFSQLGICKVVLVDDNVHQTLDPSVIIDALAKHDHIAALLAADLPDVQLDPQADAVFEQISARLDELDEEKRRSIEATLQEAAPDVFDRGVFDQLRSLIPEGVSTSFLTPEEWASEKDDLLAECSEQRRTLFLFDQELGNGDEQVKGSTIIQELSREHKPAFGSRWFCGILSHTLQSGDEVETWLVLADVENISMRFFMPIAKGSLSDAPQFYAAVYRTLINTYCATMKDLAKEAFSGALDSTLTEFTSLDPIDFEHAVVKSSEQEGVSELETLIRLYGIIHRDNVKAQILKEANLAEFAFAADAVKAVADVGRLLPHAAQERLNKLRKTELYEEESKLNVYHDPLRSGDIFRIGEGESARDWILIAQPCDLMVRSDGKRAREDNFRIAVLAPLRLKGASPPKQGLSFDLDHLDDGDGYADFREATPVNLRVLDLAVLNKSGRCEIGPSMDGAQPPHLPSKAWSQRATVLADHFASVTTKVEAAREKHNDDVATMLAAATIPRLSQAKKLAQFGTLDDGRFVYPVVRSSRLREPLATSLLTAFSRYLSRDAFDHDFASAADAA